MAPGLYHRVVILGADGQLGGEFRHRLPTAVTLNRQQADITSERITGAALMRLNPDLVLNCAAYNDVDQAEREPEAAFAVNALALRNLAQTCQQVGATLVHVSTDAVFGADRSRRVPYGEEALPGPVNTYGTSKLAGEYLAAANCEDCLIVRTCGLYGRQGRSIQRTSFVDRILAKARAGETLRVVNDQHCTPSYAADVAAGTIEMLALGIRGLAHLTNQGACTWYEFAVAALQISGVRAKVEPIKSADWKALARRPNYTILANEFCRRLSLPPLPDWHDALTRYLAASS